MSTLCVVWTLNTYVCSADSRNFTICFKCNNIFPLRLQASFKPEVMYVTNGDNSKGTDLPAKWH